MFIPPVTRALRGGRTLRALLLPALMLFAAGAIAAEPLGFDQALGLARERSRQLAAYDAAASAAREMAVAAGQLPDPVFKVGVSNLPLSGTDRYSLTRDFMTMRNIGLMQEFTRADKRQARSARFEREADVAEAGRAAALVFLQQATAMAWLERHYLERMLELLQSQRSEAGLQVEAADSAYRSGRGSQADVFAARLAAARVDDRIRDVARQVDTATTRLARTVGEEATRPLGPPPAMPALRHAGGAADGLAGHPQIALMAGREALARAEADIALRNRQPDWNVELMYSQRGSQYADMVSINVSIPLQFDRKNRQDRELGARLASVEQMRAEREDATREYEAELQGWQQAWRGNRDRLAHYDDTLLPLAGERTQAALVAYRGNRGPLDAVLEARRMEIDLRLDRLRLEMDTAVLWARLNYLLPADGDADARPAPVMTER